FQDVACGDQDWRERAGHQVTVRIARMAHAHVPIGVEHALLGENAVGGNEVLQEGRVYPAAGARYRLRRGGMRARNDQHRDGESADSDVSRLCPLPGVAAGIAPAILTLSWQAPARQQEPPA